MHAIYYSSLESPWSDFLFTIIELFRNVVLQRRYKWTSVEVGAFRKGWVTLSANFRRKVASPTNHCWCQSNRVVALSCGIKNICSASFSFVTIHTRDRRTDRLRQQYRALHCMQSHGKNWMSINHNSQLRDNEPMWRAWINACIRVKTSQTVPVTDSCELVGNASHCSLQSHLQQLASQPCLKVSLPCIALTVQRPFGFTTCNNSFRPPSFSSQTVL